MGLNKKKIIRKVIFISAISGLVFLSLFLSLKTKEAKEVILGGQKFSLELAVNPEQHYKGLSGREYLCNNCGMLFLFDTPAPKTFVMREMLFPLDIIFINGGVVVDIYKNLPPEGKMAKNAYHSSGNVDSVIEINGGRADEIGLKVGDHIILE